MSRILITGSDGQLGTAIKSLIPQFERFKFYCYDLPDLDITDFRQTRELITDTKPSIIINCAAYTAVDKAEEEKETAFTVNAEAVRNLGDIARENSIRLFHISTDYVFDGNKNTPYREDDTTGPVSVYGKSKLRGEEYLNGLDNIMVIRTSWLYSSLRGSFLNKIMKRASENDHLKVVYDQTGSPTYATDLAMALLEIADKCQRQEIIFQPGIYHYANEGVTSWYDFAVEILKSFRINCPVLPVESSEFPSTVKRPHYSVLSKQKIKEVYQLSIPHWRDSMGKCIQELRRTI